MCRWQIDVSLHLKPASRVHGQASQGHHPGNSMALHFSTSSIFLAPALDPGPLSEQTSGRIAEKRETGGWSMPVTLAGNRLGLVHLPSLVSCRVAIALEGGK